jgi:hypothetical protein
MVLSHGTERNFLTRFDPPTLPLVRDRANEKTNPSNLFHLVGD